MVGPESDVSGLGGIFSKLTDEHGEATRLLAYLLASSNAETRAQLYPALRSALLAHEHAEASVLYAALRQYPSANAIVEEHARDSDEPRAAVQLLDSLEFASESWVSQLNALFQLLRAHVQREERDFFPLALAAIGPTASQDLREAFCALNQAS